VNIFDDHRSAKMCKGVALRQEKALTAPTVPAKKKYGFDQNKFLATIGERRKVAAFPKKRTIFTQGDQADPHRIL
jgi:hypothetical protein